MHSPVIIYLINFKIKWLLYLLKKSVKLKHFITRKYYKRGTKLKRECLKYYKHNWAAKRNWSTKEKRTWKFQKINERKVIVSKL